MSGTASMAQSPGPGGGPGQSPVSEAKNGPAVITYGISAPISTQKPTDADATVSEKMMQDLESEMPRESPQSAAHSEAVLQDLERAVQSWVVEVATEQGVPEEEVKGRIAKSVRVLPLGAFRMSVFEPGSEVNALCLGPPQISREIFFTAFLETLRQRSGVQLCVPISDAFTPSVRLKMGGISIHLVFARLARPLEEAQAAAIENLRDEEAGAYPVLRGMDDKSVRSFNARRDADMILQLVPKKETFQQALRFIRCWAKRRGVYSASQGFLGGISWAILVARVCQLYPYYTACQLVNRFFRVYDQWNWIKPVMLADVVETQSVSGMSGVKGWSSKNPADRQQFMPILTPAFPCCNSASGVTETTKRILLDEFRRGYDVMKNVEAQRADWKEVRDPYAYFSRFRSFIWIELLAKTEPVYLKFKAFVETKLQYLVTQLEALEAMGNSIVVHPIPEQFPVKKSTTDPEWPMGCGMFIALAFYKDQGAFVGQTIDIRPALSAFVEELNQWPEKDAHTGQFLLRLRRIRNQQLPEYALAAVADADKKRAKADAASADSQALKKTRSE
eukprot:TRINITY_DN24916_c0_g1_i1.p1 TRINITY_DN24916_c0_g1~~TRINITY_DN24916_c0_g1_i1.p1  ORF type:complete len:562 (-),score=148.33 TRINITY_DN24916_c0_g1_i1:134-1819(-)